MYYDYPEDYELEAQQERRAKRIFLNLSSKKDYYRINLNSMLEYVKKNALCKCYLEDLINLLNLNKDLLLGFDCGLIVGDGAFECDIGSSYANDVGYYCLINANSYEDAQYKEQLIKSFLVNAFNTFYQLRGRSWANMEDEFLRLNANPSYYRLNLLEVLTNCPAIAPGYVRAEFQTACHIASDVLSEVFNLEAIWGWGVDKYDEGCEFENNKGYYLFFKVASLQEGKDIAKDVLIHCNDYDLSN